MLTHFYLVLQAETLVNAFLANLGKFSGEACPQTPLEGQKFSLPRKLFWVRHCPPPPQAQKPSYGPELIWSLKLSPLASTFSPK